MPIKIGNTNITAIKVGNTNVTKVIVGGTTVWTAGTPLPAPYIRTTSYGWCSWDAISNANGYTIYKNGVSAATTIYTGYDLSALVSVGQTATFTVVANGSGSYADSPHSNSVSYTRPQVWTVNIYTNNDNYDSASWNVNNGNSIYIGSDYVEKDYSTSISAGSKSGYDFYKWYLNGEGYLDTGYLTVNRDMTIDGKWDSAAVELGSCEIGWVWYENNSQLVVRYTRFYGQVGSCSVDVDDRWTVGTSEFYSVSVSFYNNSGSYIGSESYDFYFVEGDGTMYLETTYTYRG